LRNEAIHVGRRTATWIATSRHVASSSRLKAAPRNKFFATNEAYEPRAALSHLWFANGDTRYILSECIGGMCPHSGGIVVAKGNKIIARIKLSDGSFTADDAVDFATPKSATPLIQIKYPDGVDMTTLYSK
jgi:hypothetical protein